MCKRNYKVTPKEFSFGTSYQVEVWDEYGDYVEVYENTRISASNFILNWWENSDKRKKQKELEKKTIQKLIKLDEQGKILKGNRDGLD
tara:strand:- start:468 stop:731 length:264 start_codon:yes stop_codon:yes gene_type:complete